MSDPNQPVPLDYATRPIRTHWRLRIVPLVLLCLVALASAWALRRWLLAGQSDAGPLPAPTDLYATALAPNKIEVGWKVHDSGQFIYDVERSTNGGRSWTSLATVAEPSMRVWYKRGSATYTDTAASPGTTYQYRVRVKEGAARSPWSNPFSGYTLAAPPAAPTDLRVSVRKDSRDFALDLTWTDNSSDEDGFNISDHDGDPGHGGSGYFAPANATSYTIRFANAGPHNITVTAAHGAQESAPATAAQRILGRPSPQACFRTENSVQIIWDAVVGAEGYTVEWGKVGEDSCVSAWTHLVDTTQTTVVHNDVPMDAAIGYKVIARCASHSQENIAFVNQAWGRRRPAPASQRIPSGSATRPITENGF